VSATSFNPLHSLSCRNMQVSTLSVCCVRDRLDACWIACAFYPAWKVLQSMQLHQEHRHGVACLVTVVYALPAESNVPAAIAG
jgi:hypothetical protein